MNLLAKKLLTQIGSVTLGVGLIAVNGWFMLNKNETNVTHVKPVAAEATAEAVEAPAETDTDSGLDTAEGNAEEEAVLTISAADLPKATEYTKASLDDYRMLLKIDKKTTSAKTAVKEESTGGNVSAYETDTTTIYDPQYEPLNFTDTRDVSAEYFTVYDIISGSTVTLNAHELLCRMVYSEIGGSWGEEAIKAQTVAAYSYLRFNDALGLTPTVGLKTGYPTRIEKCVSAVEGQAVYYDNEIINAVYSASTAGYSVESERIWDVYYPYLRAVVSEYDYEDPNYGLEYSFTTDEVRSALEEACSITLSDNIDNWLTVEDIYSGMYVGYINVDGQVTITCRTFEELFGLKSQAITIERTDTGFLFKSYGWGHGVGMSQWGACYYAEHGYTYDQILRHYYLNTTIGLSTESSKAVARGEAYNTNDTDDTDSTSGTSSTNSTDSTYSAGSTDSSSYSDSSSASQTTAQTATTQSVPDVTVPEVTISDESVYTDDTSSSDYSDSYTSNWQSSESTSGDY